MLKLRRSGKFNIVSLAPRYAFCLKSLNQKHVFIIGISDGEHLCASQLASEGEEGRGGSEGEPTAGLLHPSLLANHKTTDEIDEDLFSYDQGIVAIFGPTAEVL